LSGAVCCFRSSLPPASCQLRACLCPILRQAWAFRWLVPVVDDDGAEDAPAPWSRRLGVPRGCCGCGWAWV
jgi:hypothetical protein